MVQYERSIDRDNYSMMGALRRIAKVTSVAQLLIIKLNATISKLRNLDLNGFHH